MPTIMISIMPDGIPVDKMEKQDAEVNEVNKMQAIDEANYRDPADDGGFKLTDICGNCGAYNQTEDMLKCIGDDSGDLGYCQIYKFMCRADHTCDDWVTGGPITADAEGSERDIL